MQVRSRARLSRTKRAELREERRAKHEANRERNKHLRAVEHRHRMLISEQQALAKHRVQNYQLPLIAEAIRTSYPSGASPTKLDMSGYKWIKTHSDTVRRKKPLQVEPGYYTQIAAARQWSVPLRGTYINRSAGIQVTGALEACCSVNPLRQAGFLAVFAGFGSGFYPVTNVEAASKAGNEVLKQVRDRKLNLAVALGEGPETFQFLKTSVKEIDVLLGAMSAKKGNPGKTFERTALRNPKNLRRMASFNRKAFNAATPERRWLEYNFALLPIVDDAQGAAEALAQRAPDLSILFAQSSARVTEGLDYNSLSGAIQSGYGIKYSGEVRSRFVNRVDYKVADSTIKQLSELGFANPGSYLYQRTPLSFVLDWVIPVGDFLDLWTAPLGCSLSAAYQATYMVCEATKQFIRTPTTDRVSIATGPETWYYRGYIRRNTTVFPYPSLYVKNPLSSWTALTSAALTRQRKLNRRNSYA